jgi:MSHA biogenesis protein MshP
MKRTAKFHRREAGVGLVTAIFLLVVLAGLGVAMVGVYTSQQASAALDLQGARAYQAARAGLEWGMFQQMRNNSCAAQTVIPMPAGTSLSGFTVVVTCTQQANAPQPLFLITAKACNVPDANGLCTPPTGREAVLRQLEVQI